MGDPYRPSQYYAPSHAPYDPGSYAPPSSDQYASGALTTRHDSTGGGSYYPSQSNMQLSQSSHQPPSTDYLDPDRPRHHRHHSSHSSSHSRHHDRDRDHDDRKRSKSRGKEWGATAVGGAAGAFLGNEFGHGPLATGAGLIVGAIGAHELERKHEKHMEKKRLEDRDGGGSGRGDRRRRRSSGGLAGLKDKVEGFLNPDRDSGRRSKSHVGSSKGGRRRDLESESDSESDREYSRREGRRRRDDYY